MILSPSKATGNAIGFHKKTIKNHKDSELTAQNIPTMCCLKYYPADYRSAWIWIFLI